MTLTVYSEDFEKGENISNGGFSGCVFLDGKNGGTSFSRNLSDALTYICNNKIEINEICFNYRNGDEQMFKRFNVSEK